MNPNYLPGHIVGVQGGFLAEAQYHIFEPQTRLYHFLVIRSRLEEEDDYEIIEMRGHGCDIGRLSWYGGSYYVVYELADPEAGPLGKKAAKYASKFGRACYKFLRFFRLPADLGRCWSLQLAGEHRIRRIRPDELKWAADDKMVCTELARAIWLEVGKDPLEPGDAALPSAFVRAEQTGRLRVVDVHYPKRRGGQTQCTAYPAGRPA